MLDVDGADAKQLLRTKSRAPWTSARPLLRVAEGGAAGAGSPVFAPIEPRAPGFKVWISSEAAGISEAVNFLQYDAWRRSRADLSAAANAADPSRSEVTAVPQYTWLKFLGAAAGPADAAGADEAGAAGADEAGAAGAAGAAGEAHVDSSLFIAEEPIALGE